MLNRIYKKNFLLAITLIFCVINTSLIAGSVLDSITNTENLKAFEWQPISGVDKIMQYEKVKDLSKNSIKKAKEADVYYTNAIGYMNDNNYDLAIEEFKSAMKRYKRAKFSEHGYNYIHINMALCYANSGNNQDKAVALRLLNLVTTKVENEKEWLYNLSIAYYLIGSSTEATENLSSAIRLDKNYFQAYITLEAIYRNSSNTSSADKVRNRMQTAEANLIKKYQKENSKKKGNRSVKSVKEKIVKLEGLKPDVTNLRIIKNDDHLQFNKVKNIKERSMDQIQEGIGAYNNGVDALSNKEYENAISELKIAEKRLKRGKVTNDGLNFTRANLSIAFLSTGEKRSLGQAKRYLKYLTKKLYNNRDWTYNTAVAFYDYASRIKGTSKDGFMKKSIKLFQLTIKHDKLFLPSYQNLIYIYDEMDEGNKAAKYQKLYEKRRDELLRSFDREEQIKLGVEKEYIFRVNLGTFGEFEAPADMFDEDYIITVPINERKTAYLAGMFYTLDEAVEYQKTMLKRGYVTAYIVAFKDGEKLEF